jgi:hypothetical protein
MLISKGLNRWIKSNEKMEFARRKLMRNYSETETDRDRDREARAHCMPISTVSSTEHDF